MHRPTNVSIGLRLTLPGSGWTATDADTVSGTGGGLMHDAVEITAPTPAGPVQQERPTGLLHLQNRGNPVRYRAVPKP